ncbi:MrcB family domain-containing protein [Nocardia wallacei]|uniref:MrcB family domain-containing protein n=1 Tax=Nocardia wallacei TaxID=480035 RepID=UPI002455154A|nr:DUF3578 domain-containing protein [Nocardia wallacei]
MASLGELLDEVLRLQPGFTTDAGASAMQRRKVLVEQEIPAWMAGNLAAAFPAWGTEGSGGKGTPAKIPWSRCFDPLRSEKPGRGWYVVYLFSADGDAVYLSLNQGTSPFNMDRQRITSLSDEYLIARADWARSMLEDSGAAPPEFGTIDLHVRRGLGHAYELGNVHGIRYQAGAMPSDEQFRSDLLRMGDSLAALYEVSDQAVFIPGDEPPEIVDAELVADQVAGKGSGQGFRLKTDEKDAIEDRAVEVATEYFESLGYEVQNTGDSKSFDLLATKEDETIYVEVKGTTSLGERVVLTYREVEHHLDAHPDNALVVVHSIRLDRSVNPATASGGVRVVHRPWKIDESALQPVSYKYVVPPPPKLKGDR